MAAAAATMALIPASGADPCMGRLSLQDEIEIHLRRGLIDDGAHRSVSVEDVTEVGLQLRIEILCAEEPHLLLDGKDALRDPDGESRRRFRSARTARMIAIPALSSAPRTVSPLL